MSPPHDPPLSRRAARQAELVAREAAPQPQPQPESATPPASVPEPLVEPPAAAGSGARVRRRDFRPRAGSPAAQEPLTPEPATDEHALTSAQVAAELEVFDSLESKFDTVLDYRTQYPELARLLATPQPAPTLQTVASPFDGPEHTMSRRDLRAARQRSAPEQREARAPENVTPGVDAVAADADADVVDVEVVDVEIVDVEVTEVEVAHVEVIEVEVAHVEVEDFDIVEVEVLDEAGLEPFTPHWSDGIHDTDDPFENTFSREVGLAASSTHTNALVLPEMPSVSIGGPVSGTGEIIITGMIDLSSTIAATGVRPAVHESPSLDDFFDDFDREVAPQDSAPVSALDAVGSYATPLGLLTPSPQPARKTLTTVLIASTVGMAAIAIGLFVVAAVNGLF